MSGETANQETPEAVTAAFVKSVNEVFKTGKVIGERRKMWVFGEDSIRLCFEL